MALSPTSSPANFSSAAIHGGQNSTNSTLDSLEKIKEWMFAWMPFYILIITVLGIMFNVFVLTVFCFHKKACTVAEIYLSNLAVADLVLVSCLPFWAVNVMRRYTWPFSIALCKFVNLCISINVYCSIYFLVLVSIDRVLALVHPLSHGTIRRPKYAKLSCLLVWAFGLILSTPVLIYRHVKHFPEFNAPRCYLNYPNITVLLVSEGTLTIFAFIIPICIISFCTFKILQVLKNPVVEGSNCKRNEQKATTLVLVVLLAFLICWVPFHVTKVIEMPIRAEIWTDKSFTKITDMCKQIFIYIGFFNSVLNPILYVIVGKNFQKKAKDLFNQWNLRRESTFNHISTHLYRSRSVNTATSSLRS